MFLKHSLNAQAVSSLEDVEIEGDVQSLVVEMQASIDETTSSIEGMEG